jgi:hypothetical protein
MRRHAAHWTPSSKKALGNSLRSYFWYRALHGERTAHLVAAIPRIAQWRMQKEVSASACATELKAALSGCQFDRRMNSIRPLNTGQSDLPWRPPDKAMGTLT